MKKTCYPPRNRWLSCANRKEVVKFVIKNLPFKNSVHFIHLMKKKRSKTVILLKRASSTKTRERTLKYQFRTSNSIITIIKIAVGIEWICLVEGFCGSRLCFTHTHVSRGNLATKTGIKTSWTTHYNQKQDIKRDNQKKLTNLLTQHLILHSSSSPVGVGGCILCPLDDDETMLDYGAVPKNS